MLEYRLGPICSRYVLLVISILISLGSVVATEASAYYSLIMESQTTVSSPEVILQEGTAGTSTIYTNNTSAKVSVTTPETVNTLELWVDGFDGTSVDWNTNGTSPYLSSVNYPTDYIYTPNDEATEEKFDFTDTSETGTLNDVKICVYTRQDGNGELDVRIYNSSGPHKIAGPVPDGSWTWYNYSCLATLSTWTEVNGAKLRLSTIQIGGPDTFYVDAALLFVNYTVYDNATYDYVLRVNNTATNSWEIRLKKYANSGIGRLQNCTIYFRNSTNENSTQIIFENGSFNQTEGPWYALGSLEAIYVAMTVEANSTGTSIVRTYLEIRVPSTTTSLQYIITFEIT